METMAPDSAHRLLYIKVRPETIAERGSLYEAVRWAWRVNPARAAEADWVVAVVGGVARGVFEVHGWQRSSANPGRYEFRGAEVDNDIARRCVGKLIPEEFRRRGMASPVLYGWGGGEATRPLARPTRMPTVSPRVGAMRGLRNGDIRSTTVSLGDTGCYSRSRVAPIWTRHGRTGRTLAPKSSARRGRQAARCRNHGADASTPRRSSSWARTRASPRTTGSRRRRGASAIRCRTSAGASTSTAAGCPCRNSTKCATGPWSGRTPRRSSDAIAVPGVDFAMTEVVHCKSKAETGVKSALRACAARWLDDVMRESAAKVVVLLGRQAEEVCTERWGMGSGRGAHFGVALAGRNRAAVVLPHPNAREPRRLAQHVAPEGLRRLRAILAGGIA